MITLGPQDCPGFSLHLKIPNLIPSAKSLLLCKTPDVVVYNKEYICSRAYPVKMETLLSVLAWRSPWTEEAPELQYTGSQRVRHD